MQFLYGETSRWKSCLLFCNISLTFVSDLIVEVFLRHAAMPCTLLHPSSSLQPPYLDRPRLGTSSVVMESVSLLVLYYQEA